MSGVRGLSTEETPRPLLVVGVGASAGGLAPLGALLHGLQAGAPLAAIVVQHLDPGHQSSLALLLARRTSLTVTTAVEDQPVEAGHVYVVPPEADLRLAKGRLHLVSRQSPHLPIDLLFESLAEDLGRGAAGVILSGTGTDGARGVRALRQAGALTFAQDTTAEHRGMPEAAIQTGCVDLVLGAEEIAEQLSASANEAEPDGALDDGVLRQLLPLLRRASNLDFSSYKPGTLRRRVQCRATLGRHRHLSAYLDALRTDDAELSALAEDLRIHATSFFRDGAVFEALSSTVLPRLVREKAPGESLRVWVPGCSTGEEVYSLSIALKEALADAGRELTLKVFGTDLSERAIERARAGSYPPGLEARVSPARLQRCFVRTETGYQVTKELRDLCVFARHDLTRDPPFSNLDLISCRTLMISLAAPLQRRVMPLLHYALRPGGVLLLGACERPANEAGFEPMQDVRGLYRRTAGALPGDRTSGEAHWPAPLTARKSPAWLGHLDVEREADRAVLARYAPPGVVVNEALSIVQFRGQTGTWLEPVSGAASLDLLRLTRQELRVELGEALDRARQSGAAAASPPCAFRVGEAEHRVILEVVPLVPPAVPAPHFVVLFHEPEAPHAVAARPRARGRVDAGLRAELSSTRASLQALIGQAEAGNEELRAANEEAISTNEELQSTNEELQAAKEELQATNEELSTINDELVQRNAEATRLNDDLTNVITSVGVAILILGRDARIRRFTPPAARLFNLIPGDVGRPLSDLRTKLQAPGLRGLASEVLESLTPREQTLTDERGHWYQLTVRPYLTTERKVDGVVVVVVDIDATQRSQALLEEARDYAEAIVDTVREPLLVLDGARRVVSANRSFYRTFKLERPALEGRPLAELGEGAWVRPELRTELDRLEALTGPDEQPLGAHTRFGGREVLVSGRPFRTRQGPCLLLAFEDVTEQREREEALRRSERSLRDMLAAASEAILIAGNDGVITYANGLAARTYGYAPEEFPGLKIEALVPGGVRAAHASHFEAFHQAPGARVMAPNLEVGGVRKDGSHFPAEVSLSTMEGEQGPMVVAFVSDITARKEAEARIAAYKQNLQQMAFDATIAEERQRRHLAADLHDNVGQTLALAQLRLKAVRGLQGAGAVDLQAGIDLVAKAINDTRELTFELSPPVLYDLGLPAAVAWFGEQLEKQHHLRVAVEADEPFVTLDDETAALLFRAVRELLTNVVKHAQIDEARVRLHRNGAKLRVLVEDEGVGFDPSRLMDGEATRSFGLFSAREQLTRLGGRFDVDSGPGRGTKVTLEIPLPGDRPEPS